MALKFDLKKFMLEKGERVGLGIAVAIGAILIVKGVIAAASSGSPSENTRKMKKGSEALAAKKEMSRPPEEMARPDPREFTVKLTTMDADPVRPSATLFDPTRLEERRGPVRVLAPEEWKTAMALAQVRAVQLTKDKDQILMVLGTGQADPTGLRGFQNTQRGGFAGKAGVPGPGERGGPGDLGSPDGGDAGVPAPGGELYSGAEITGPKAYDTKWAKVESAHLLPNAKPADTVKPMRMAIIVGSFPYKKQVEEFQHKLSYLTLADLLVDSYSLPVFEGFEVRRQAWDLSGRRVIERWRNIDIEGNYDKLVRLETGPRFEPDDPELYPVLMDGLATPRPAQHRPNQYPKPEQELTLIKKTLEDLKKAVTPTQLVKPRRPGLDANINVFRPDGGQRQFIAAGVDPGGVPVPGGVPGPGDVAMGGAADLLKAPGQGGFFTTQQLQWTPPDYCLLRFVDWTIQPGRIYEYQIRVIMANPNYGRKDVQWKRLSETKQIRSDWVPVTAPVFVPPEIQYYVVDQKLVEPKDSPYAKRYQQMWAPKRDEVALQIHRWVTYFQPNPSETKQAAVGDWVIAERVLAHRGDFLFPREHKAEVPVWAYLRDRWILALNNKETTEAAKKKPPVPLATGFDPILVDFEGGDVRWRKTFLDRDGNPYVREQQDKAAVELLLLTADGKLLLRDSSTDTEDPERKKRLDTWRKRVEEADESKDKRDPKTGTGPFGGGN
jgi:hypothetical protein